MNITRIQSRVEAVTVYRTGALVRRVADISRRDDGYPSFVCITGLPLSLQDATLRVRLTRATHAADDANALPIASDMRVTLDVPGPDDSLPPPVDEELRAVRQRLRKLNGRISQVKRELSRIERLVITSRPRPRAEVVQAPPPSPTSARISLLEERQHHERRLRTDLARLEQELYQAELDAKKLEARNLWASNARQANEHELRKALVIAVHEPPEASASTARLIVEYLVPGARWAPAYTVRLDHEGNAAFAMRAVVAQKSGEDWGSVQLTLSTADAHGWNELPEMTSMRIGRAQALPKKTGWRPPPSGVDELFGDYDRELRSRDGRTSSTRAGGFSQWEDETRELTAPSRRMPAELSRMAEAVEDVDYDGMDDTSVFMDELEETTVPNLRPPPAPMAAPPPGPPPPMPSAPPAPMMARSAAAPPMRSRRGASAKKRKSSGRASYPMADAASQSGAMLFGGMAPGAGGGGFSAQEQDRREPMAPGTAESPAAAITASDDLLAYANLRMPGPHSRYRGSLQKADQTAVYMELLVEQHIEVSFNVLAVIAVATQRAESIANTPLPARCRAAGSDRYDYAYVSDTPVDVPSDGAFHSIPLTHKPAPTRLQYVVVPRESTDVFRVAELDNPLGSPILHGPADIYLDKDFLLTSDIPFTPPGGTVRLGLGVEQSVKVTRNTSYREETSGLLRGSLLLMHGIRIEVQNLLDRPIDCEVRERIPATREDEDDIEVKVERVQPSWDTYKPELASSVEVNLKGGRCWNVRVDAKGGKATLEAEYSVKIPSKYELVGGNRREV